MAAPRSEHPRPQFHRDTWQTLNGTWDFDTDRGLSGRDRGWHEAPALARRITVPFCPESRLSGIGDTDFMGAVWYRRQLDVPPAWRGEGQRLRLHFGAVDYDCRAWVNGRPVGRHLGGAASFHFDITEALGGEGSAELVVEARDDTRCGRQPGGKQSHRWQSHGCHYTRTTGIWQSVWLEAVPASRIEAVGVVPDLEGGRFVLTPVFAGTRRGQRLRATLLAGLEADQVLRQVEAPALSGGALALKVDAPRPWSPADPHLYGLRFELLGADGSVCDTVHSYAGLRSFCIEGHRLYLNDAPIFLRLVLDQGFYPEGVWTAPTDADLKGDIERAQAVGFNGARLHQKVFEERFHYWADRLGYLTWGEFCDWGLDFGSAEGRHNHQREWSEVVRRDRNHPSIVAWTPFNETAGGARAHTEAHHQALRETYDLTRALDPSRPCHDTSGYVHVVTDIFTVHDYDQDPASFAARYAGVDPADPAAAHVNQEEHSIRWGGQPYLVDEYGGTWWVEGSGEAGTNREAGWGYGNRPATIEEVYRRIEGLTGALTRHPHVSGFCYTQLTDVEQEQNGIYTYDRRQKFDAARLRAAFGAPAAIEAASA